MSANTKKTIRQNNLVLFPLCDRRGWVTAVLSASNQVADLEQQRPETLFFAWLLDLPESISPSAAATSVIAVSGLDRHPPSPRQRFRRRLYQMLVETSQSYEKKRVARPNKGRRQPFERTDSVARTDWCAETLTD